MIFIYKDAIQKHVTIIRRLPGVTHTMHNKGLGVQPHLAQCYSRRISLMFNGVHESKIYFTVQLGANNISWPLEGEIIHHASRCFVEEIFYTNV